MEMFSKTEYKEALQNGVYDVKFIKADGTERVMTCTLMPSFLPENTVNEEATPRKENDNVISVWDLEKFGWRSFRIDSVISFNPYSQVPGTGN